jgi:hypothetical protein
MDLRVHRVQQRSSGGDHVTIYDADIELVAGNVDVQVVIVGVDPTDADPDAVGSAKEAIRRGAAKVLQPRGIGAIIRVQRLVVHSVDFKPRRFEQHTAEELQRLLAAEDGECDQGGT